MEKMRHQDAVEAGWPGILDEHPQPCSRVAFISAAAVVVTMLLGGVVVMWFVLQSVWHWLVR